MEAIRIAILSTADQPLAYMDNSTPKALHYYDDELHEYLEGSAYTFVFKAFAGHEDSGHLAEGNKISFQYRGKDYYLNIMKVVRTEYELEIEAYGLSLELLNERTKAYKAEKAMSLTEYIAAFKFESRVLTVGINEVSDKKITHEWTGTDTILARLFSLANVFGAEIEFAAQLNDNYSMKQIIMNIYKANSDSNQGIGTRRTDVRLRYGTNVTGVTKTSDVKELYTAIRPYGKDGLTIASLEKSEYDSDGNLEYTTAKGSTNLLAVQARDRFPSNMMANTIDRYIAQIWEYDTDNVNVLYGQALAELKKHCVPQVKYEVKGYFDTGIGDTVVIEDDQYSPALYLEARVTEQVRSFTNPKLNRTTFDNYEELQSQLDPALISRVKELIAENKVYTCTVSTDNGIVFKNSEGSTTLTAHVRDAGADVTDDFTIRWQKDDADLAEGASITVYAEDVNEKSVYRFEAVDSSGKIRGFCEVTVTDVTDGKTPYIHYAYANSDDGTIDFSVTDSKDRKYIGRYSDYAVDGSTDPADYQWSKITGDPGETGVGILSVVQKYAVSSSNVTAPDVWTEDEPPSMTVIDRYLWNYTITVYTNGSTHETAKHVIGVYGDTGIGVKSGKTEYQLSDSGTDIPDGEWSPTIPAASGGQYLWTRMIITYTDESKSTSYSVGRMGEDGKDAAIISQTEPEGKSYLWCDTSESPAVIKRWNGDAGEWEIVNDESGQIDQIYNDLIEEIKEAVDGVKIEVGEKTYTKGEVETLLAEQSTQYSQDKESFNFQFTAINTLINDLTDVTNTEIQNRNKYIRFIDGAIYIGVENNPLILKLANDRISFLENNAEVAYISNRIMYITHAEILKDLKIGRFAWVYMDSGYLPLRLVE